ncbi:hypothetical protein C8R44DRAFT_883082 [Mycena epipterygia]|nr:hypothetical protein C8R44DRAFT_883082 [Mycena epipterygia]
MSCGLANFIAEAPARLTTWISTYTNEQVVNCKDELMEVDIQVNYLSLSLHVSPSQVVTDEPRLHSLRPFLSATHNYLHLKINIKQILIALIDWLIATYMHDDNVPLLRVSAALAQRLECARDTKALVWQTRRFSIKTREGDARHLY